MNRQSQLTKWRGVSTRQRIINTTVQFVLWPLPLALILLAAGTDNRILGFLGAGIFFVGGPVAVWIGGRVSHPEPDAPPDTEADYGSEIEDTASPEIPRSRKSKPPAKEL